VVVDFSTLALDLDSPTGRSRIGTGDIDRRPSIPDSYPDVFQDLQMVGNPEMALLARQRSMFVPRFEGLDLLVARGAGLLSLRRDHSGGAGGRLEKQKRQDSEDSECNMTSS